MLNSKILLFLILPLSAACLWAQTPSEETTLSDAEIAQRLNTTDVLAWERAMQLKKEGESLVDSGNILQSRKASAFRTPADVAQDKKDGKAMVELGESKIAEAEAQLQVLRDKVLKNYSSTAPAASVQEYKLKVQTTNFDKALEAMSEQLLFNLWDQGYRRIFVMGSWINRNGALEETPDISGAVFDLMRDFDGSRYSVIPSKDKTFTYQSFAQIAEIKFEDKDRLVSDYKVALVYLEIVPSLDNSEALISMRAIDADTLQLLDAQLSLSPVNTSLSSILGSAPDNAPKPTPILVTLTDDNNLIERIAVFEPPYRFGYRYVGNANSYRGLRANVIVKSLLLPSGAKLYDHDFLMLAMGTEDPMEETSPAGNALWQLEPGEPGNPPVQTFKVDAVSLKKDQEVPVAIGKLEIVSEGLTNEAS